MCPAVVGGSMLEPIAFRLSSRRQNKCQDIRDVVRWKCMGRACPIHSSEQAVTTFFLFNDLIGHDGCSAPDDHRGATSEQGSDKNSGHCLPESSLHRLSFRFAGPLSHRRYPARGLVHSLMVSASARLFFSRRRGSLRLTTAAPILHPGCVLRRR